MSRRVLVIDDSELIRAAAQLGLQRDGFTVDLAEDGESGLEAVRTAVAEGRGPDAVLLDLVLPDIGGEVVLARLRADPASAGVPVVLLTASPEEALAHGADAVIPKPFPPLELGAQLRAALGWVG